jgi:RNA polymerase sigma-70 factor (ECF subfamily)
LLIINRKIESYTDEDLLAFIKKSNDSKFIGELYRRYIPLVYGLCLKYLNNQEKAQDAVMDVFALLVDKMANYEIKNFSTWLYSVAKNHCFQIIRKEKQTISVNIEDVVVENDASFTLLDKQQSDEEVEALNYCMTTLCEEQRTSINYFFYEEKSYAEIVDLTGYALGQVKSYIQNGKRNLKNCVVQFLSKL